jgi:hypothetical protein
MKNLNYIWLLLLLPALTSCKKGISPGDCFKTTGTVTTEQREVPAFRNVVLKDNISLYLKNGSSNSIKIEAGKNLLPKIKTEVDEKGNLIISNQNRCNWMRSYDVPVTAYLEFNRLDTLFYASTGNVMNMADADTLYFGDSLCVEIEEGSGDLKLNYKAGYLRVAFTYGTSDVVFTGVSTIISIYSSAWGKIDFHNIKCPTVWAINNSSNDMLLRASKELRASTESLGNIYIYGNPPEISFNKEGKGDLISVP